MSNWRKSYKVIYIDNNTFILFSTGFALNLHYLASFRIQDKFIKFCVTDDPLQQFTFNEIETTEFLDYLETYCDYKNESR